MSRRSAAREVTDRSTLEHPELQALFELWQARARGGVVLRTDLDVLDLGPWLGWLVLTELVGGEFLCRVHGTCLAERFGRDMTGKPLADHLQVRHREPAIAELRRVVDTGRPLAVTIAELDGGGRWTRWEKLMLPLSRPGAGAHQVLAGLYPFESAPAVQEALRR